MGLLSIIRKQKLKEKEVRLLLLGLDNSGKSTIVKSMLGQDVKETSPTMGFDICTVSYAGFNINIWDIGGQTSLRAFWFNYFEKTDFLMWVIDSSSLHRLQENFVEFSRVLGEDRLAGCGVVIMVNKMDLFTGDRDELRTEIIRILGLERLENHAWQIIFGSAYTGENIRAGLDWIVAEYKTKYLSL
ncbi:uncharacterized protein OGAPODRAFT_86058 [Ogataea polymorpha]|uniref:uncharacterized protein n=1 Tax=Ogataea polymorpha TaxID=460523 RepID=UPI0007F349A4|nr:uncharacterized protein OGAPODRAFT_86058 [Ogataea polymorpha]OBA17600.1 hypothetical protein OGAPODRAFT_86058 [Ogataea polymorpha]